MKFMRTPSGVTTALLALTLVAGSAGAQDAKPAADWTKKLTFASPDGKFELELGSRVQVRYTYLDPDNGDSTGSFRIRRAKLALSGHVYDDWKYKIQAVWSGGSTTLEDAYFQYAANPMAQAWLGQGKAFFGRQELTSSGKQQFVDRSIVSSRFAHGRDQGIALVGVVPSKVLEYQVGLYNGNGINKSSNDNGDYLTTARVAWMPLGEYKLEESALDYPASPKVSVGLAGLQNTTGTGATEVDVQRLNAELAFKWQGVNAVAEYYTEDAEPVSGSSVDTDGYYAQLGYLFPNKTFEVAARHAVISRDGVDDDTEDLLGLSWYLGKHDYKLQADFGVIEQGGKERNEGRLQLQIAF